jgi:hypothetical protein
LDDEEKITKSLAHCEESPAPQVADSEKVYIFSNSAKLPKWKKIHREFMNNLGNLYEK